MLYLDTYSGPVVVTLTGNETKSRVSGERYVEVSGWLKEPTYVTAHRLAESETPEDANRIFGHNTMAMFR